MPTLDAALLCSSRVGSDLGRESGLVEELCQLGFLISNRELKLYPMSIFVFAT